MTAMTADVATVRTELDAGRPVLLGVVVYDCMFLPTSAGRVELPPAGSLDRGRHAVLAVGYDADALLIRNSWGVTWALAGYGWLTDSYSALYLKDVWAISSGVIATTTVTAAITASGGVYGSA
jgi:C1A family cysteine protease